MVGNCDCDFCVDYDRYRWAVIMACPCVCHDYIEPSGHESLCCEFPNGKRKDNPHEKLESVEYYKEKLEI